jgi:hypothetical protein
MAPLCHILPIHNSTINSNNLFVNFHWMFTFALRNRMTECMSHLAGLWIGAAISNTPHSNKAGSTTAKRAWLTGKDQVRRQCCHTKHKKFPYQPTLDVSLYIYVLVPVCALCMYYFSFLVPSTYFDNSISWQHDVDLVPCNLGCP